MRKGLAVVAEDRNLFRPPLPTIINIRNEGIGYRPKIRSKTENTDWRKDQSPAVVAEDRNPFRPPLLSIQEINMAQKHRHYSLLQTDPIGPKKKNSIGQQQFC